MIVVNSSFAMAPFADALFAGDFAWWTQYARDVASFRGERWTVSARARAEYGINFVQPVANPMALRMQRAIFSGVNSGHNAVAMAALFGAAMVILLGFDMGHAADGRKHWHPDHPGKMGNGGDFSKWRSQFRALVLELRVRRVHVLNASRVTALTCCERMPLREALA